ncbi:MAG: TIGR01777 family oxidoreductase [Bacteroidota bacterium]|nr:TIGR01777 family oxidoreductase [Bacteroidota bacterium]
MAKVLITGASGLIGHSLTELLLTKGHSVVHLGRKENLTSPVKCYKWQIEKGYIDPKAFENIDTIVHLAGAGITDKRWSAERKKEIVDSRVQSGKLLVEEMNKRKDQIKTFVGASAIGIYGAITNDTIYTEDMPPHTDFMASICSQWENSYAGIDEFACKKCIIRIGVVLSEKGGALVKMNKTAKMGIMSPLGTGKQYMPWIHMDDLTNLFFEAITNPSYKGIYNAVAPQHLTNREFSIALTRALGKKMWAPKVPSFILKLILGEMAVIVLEGSRVSAEKILRQGFTFKHKEIDIALKDFCAG